MKMVKNMLKGSLVVGLLTICFLPINAMAESKMHIKFSTWHPPVAREVKTVFIPMLEKLKAESNGRITYTMYAGGALGKGPEHYDIASKRAIRYGLFYRHLDTWSFSFERCAVTGCCSGR